MYSEKKVVLGQNWVNSGKVVVFLQSGCIREKVVVLLQSGCTGEKSACIRAEVVSLYLVKSGCIHAKWFYSGKSGNIYVKVVVFGQE